MKDIVQCKQCRRWVAADVFYHPSELKLRPRPTPVLLVGRHFTADHKIVCGMSQPELADHLDRCGLFPWLDSESFESSFPPTPTFPQYRH